MLSYKYIPASGEWGKADIAYATLSPPAKQGRVLRRQRGAGSVEFLPTRWEDMPTQHHVINAFADLPLLELRGGFLLDTEGGTSGSATVRLE
jgi:hypothetical protein